MNTARTWLLSLVALLACAAGTARAENAVTLTPLGDTVHLGGAVQLQVGLEADDDTLGGGVRVYYDVSRLRFERFDFDPALGADPQLRRGPQGGSDDLPLRVAFGHESGLSGERRVGTLVFTAIAEGVAVFSCEPAGLPAGPFVDAAGDALAFDYGSAAVTIGSAASVPVFGAAGLLLAAGALLVAVRLGLRAR